MKKHLLTFVVATVLLGGCSAPATAPEATTTSATKVTSATDTADPARTSSNATAEPTTLKEALTVANMEHTDVVEAVGAMEDLYRQAQTSLKPSMADADWYKIDIIRINTSIGALNGKMTDKDVILGVKEYTIAIEREAVRQGRA